jgi:hypothetical protein
MGTEVRLCKAVPRVLQSPIKLWNNPESPKVFKHLDAKPGNDARMDKSTPENLLKVP